MPCRRCCRPARWCGGWPGPPATPGASDRPRGGRQFGGHHDRRASTQFCQHPGRAGIGLSSPSAHRGGRSRLAMVSRAQVRLKQNGLAGFSKKFAVTLSNTVIMRLNLPGGGLASLAGCCTPSSGRESGVLRPWRFVLVATSDRRRLAGPGLSHLGGIGGRRAGQARPRPTR